MVVVINYKKCCWKDGKCVSCSCGKPDAKCEGCVEACPVGALKREKIVVIIPDKCINCGACVTACTKGAIKIK